MHSTIALYLTIGLSLVSIQLEPAYAQRSDLFRRSDALTQRWQRGIDRKELSFAERRQDRGGPSTLSGTDPETHDFGSTRFSDEPTYESDIFGSVPRLDDLFGGAETTNNGELFGPVPLLNNLFGPVPRLSD